MPETIRVRFDETTSETIEVTDLGGGRYRLEATPLCALKPVHRGDTIELRGTNEAGAQFVRVVEPAPTRGSSTAVSACC